MASETSAGESPSEDVDRRSFLSAASTAGMLAGLGAGYGTFAVLAGRFLYSGADSRMWQFLATIADFKVGDSLTYVSPDGAKVVVARQNEEETAEAFIALSSVCPHLGCQVHWEAHRDRFFCPCHNGAFDPEGEATEGPPAAAKQRLQRFPLKVDHGMLFIEVSSQAVAQWTASSPLVTDQKGPFA